MVAAYVRNPGCIAALLDNEGDSFLVLTLWTVNGALKSVPPCRRKPHAVVRASRCRLTWHSVYWLGIALGRVHAVRNATSPWRRHRRQIPLQPGPEVDARPRLRVIDTAAKTRSTVFDPSRSENAVGMRREAMPPGNRCSYSRSGSAVPWFPAVAGNAIANSASQQRSCS